MKYYFFMVLIAVIAPVCSALTVFQSWEAMDSWIQVNQADNPITVQPNGAYYVAATLQRNRVAGYAGLYYNIGDLFPVGTTGGNIQECWIQFDYQCQGSSSYWTANFGLYNSNGTNATSDGFQMLGGQIVGATVQFGGIETASSSTNGGAYAIERVKMHLYNEDGNTYVDFDVQTYNLATGTLTPLHHVDKFLALSSSHSLAYTLDAFGIRNAYNWGSSVRSATFYFDNLYFSTEGSYEDTQAEPVPVPFGMTCTNTLGDFTGDCKVNFKDLAAISEEWLDCAIIPARLCYNLLN